MAMLASTRLCTWRVRSAMPSHAQPRTSVHPACALCNASHAQLRTSCLTRLQRGVSHGVSTSSTWCCEPSVISNVSTYLMPATTCSVAQA